MEVLPRHQKVWPSTEILNFRKKIFKRHLKTTKILSGNMSNAYLALAL